jgi:hypothetical protein
MRACTARCKGQTSAMTNSAKTIGAKIACAGLERRADQDGGAQAEKDARAASTPDMSRLAP